MSRTDAILKRLTTLYPRFMDLDLARERRLLDKLGNPEQRLPPVIHVAGTNAKGSTIAYLRAGAPRMTSHDPFGVWMVWLLWLLVLLLGVTGWLSRLDMFWGEDSVLIVHSWLADALLVAVLIHLLGVLVMSFRWRENLPGAMLTGRKRPQDR